MREGMWWQRVDAAMIRFMSAWGIWMLRVCLGLVFIWFGALKVSGHSPVVELVAAAVPWFPPEVFVPFLGVWEMLVGAGLLFRVALRLTLLLFWLQMAGTRSEEHTSELQSQFHLVCRL